MARNIAVDLEEVDYVPDIEDNRNDPDPFVVRIKPMTAAEMKMLERSMGEMTAGKAANFLERADKVARAIFKRCVVSVRGYTARSKDGTVMTPSTGVELYDAVNSCGDPAESAVIDDIYAAIKDHSHLRAGLPEVLRSRSGS